jgi:hypothetical protein
VFRELFTLIEAFPDDANGLQMQLILKKMPPKARAHWTDLVRVALNQSGVSDKKFKTILTKIRANLSFHYYQPKQLVAGYRRHFYESGAQPGNAHAYASMGKNMERTRFYFADAAIQGSLELLQDSKGFLPRLKTGSDAANHAIRFLLEEYLRPARRPFDQGH